MWKLWKTSLSEGSLKGLLERLEALEKLVRDLEADNQAIRVEWATYYKKIARLAGHLTKTAALDAPPEPEKPLDPDRRFENMTRDEIARM